MQVIAPLTRSPSSPIIATESRAYRKKKPLTIFPNLPNLKLWIEHFCGEMHFNNQAENLTFQRPQNENSFKKQQRIFVLIFLLRPPPPIFFLLYKHESQKVFFGEWAWHEGAIKMLVVLKRKALFWKGWELHLFFLGAASKYFLSGKKKKVGWMLKWWNSFYFSSLSRLFLSERNNMESCFARRLLKTLISPKFN